MLCQLYKLLYRSTWNQRIIMESR